MAQRIFSIIEEAEPLLTQVCSTLADVRDSGLLKEVENLTQNLIQASDDLRVHSSIMTPGNTELLQTINTISFTLKNIENFSKDIAGFTGDETTKRSSKLLFQNLSRHL
ncbi:Protein TRIGALACTOSYLDIACYLGLYCEROL 2, chloroplastic [Glycine max]|nr:Protein TRIGALACTOSYLDIACYLGLYCEROL 2, chloroplastic [Glycine max]